MHVILVRERGFWPVKWGDKAAWELARWGGNPDDNARNAIGLAEQMLAQGAGTDRLGGLEGYRRGGAW